MRMLAGIAAVIAIFYLRTALSEKFAGAMATVAADRPANCLALLGSTTREEAGMTFIVGSIRNNCGRKVGSVTIAFKLQRPSQSELNLPDAPVFAYASDVQPGETRSFKSTFQIGRDTIYRFAGITAF